MVIFSYYINIHTFYNKKYTSIIFNDNNQVYSLNIVTILAYNIMRTYKISGLYYTIISII
jgi:hypothetical protein